MMINRILYSGKIITCILMAIYVALGCPMIENAFAEGTQEKIIEQDLPKAGEMKIENGGIIEYVTTKNEVSINEIEVSSSKYISEHDQEMLKKIAMAEAGCEDIIGKALIMNVVLNRKEDEKFPDDVEEVIRQKNQFSPVNAGTFDKTVASEECQEALNMVINGWDNSNGALYFASNGYSEWHKSNLEFLYKHGNHNFYR